MAGKSARKLLVSAAVGISICVALAVPVFAFASRSSHTVIIPPALSPKFGSSTATCPAGQHVLFGGYRNGLAGMRRTANNQWTVEGFNLAPNPTSAQPLHLTSFVYCGRGALASKMANTKVINGSGSVAAQCPAGSVVLGGGFATTPHTAAVVSQLERVAANRWRVSAFMYYLSGHTALTAIAYCGPGPAPIVVSSTRHSTGTARATCPAGKNLIFGGMVATPKPDYVFVRTLRAETNNRWAAAGSIVGPHNTLTALAYCR